MKGRKRGKKINKGKMKTRKLKKKIILKREGKEGREE